MKFQIEVIKSKIHRVTVTQADLNYVGSITIDEALLEAANIIEGEKVQIMDINNGERFETYVIKGERASGCICLNGAAARKVQVGDVIIIASYALMDFEDAKQFKPWVIFPDTANASGTAGRKGRKSKKSPLKGDFFAINVYICRC
jgi:aspartate 1-decarboxylase